MEGWPRISLCELVDIVTGGTPVTSRKAYWGGRIPWVTATDLTSGQKFLRDTLRTITDEGLLSVKGRTVPAGGIVISARGTVGLLGMAAAPMALNQSCYGLIAKPGLMDKDFLYYLLKMLVGEFSLISHGSIFDSITKDTFKEIAAPIPRLRTQEIIGKILSSLDDKLDLLSMQNRTLEELAELEYSALLARCPGSVARLDNLAHIAAGRHLPRENFKPGGLYPVYGAAGPVGRADNFLHQDDLLVTGRVGTLGNVTMIKAPERVWPTENTLVFSEVKHLHFLYFFLKNANLARYNSGSTQSLLRRCDLAEIEVKLPPASPLSAYERLAGPLFSKIHTNKAQIEALASLRDCLLPKLVAGKIVIIPSEWA